MEGMPPVQRRDKLIQKGDRIGKPRRRQNAVKKGYGSMRK